MYDEKIQFYMERNITTIGIVFNTNGAILLTFKARKKNSLPFFVLDFGIVKGEKNGRKLKHISMKRIAELILFKCDKHLIRMQSPPPSPSTSIPHLANFIVWKKNSFFDLSVNACKHICIVYLFVLSKAQPKKNK